MRPARQYLVCPLPALSEGVIKIVRVFLRPVKKLSQGLVVRRVDYNGSGAEEIWCEPGDNRNGIKSRCKDQTANG